LINERIQHVNRIKGLLAIHGIYDYQPLRRDRSQSCPVVMDMRSTFWW
jgi:transposase